MCWQVGSGLLHDFLAWRSSSRWVRNGGQPDRSGCLRRQKGDVVGKTLPIARDRARKGIRNKTNAPGNSGTQMQFTIQQAVQGVLVASMPVPSLLRTSVCCAKPDKHIVEYDMLNGEVIGLARKLTFPAALQTNTKARAPFCTRANFVLRVQPM